MQCSFGISCLCTFWPYRLQNGIVFALFTLPGSVLSALTSQYIPHLAFKIFFGLLLTLLAALLFFKKRKLKQEIFQPGNAPGGWKHLVITDKKGESYSYTFIKPKEL